MKNGNVGLMLMMTVSLWLAAGCGSPQSIFQEGQVDQVRFVRTDSYRNWVEIPNQPPTQESARVLTEDVVLTREVEQINSDGSTILKVTFNQVNITDKRLVQGDQPMFQYSSTPEKTTSTQGNEPALSGASYRVKLAPDTTVLEIMGLESLRQELGLAEGAVGLAALMLEENRIKICHEREFLQSGVEAGQPATRLFPVYHEMNKAKALEKTYTAQKTQSPRGTDALSVNMTGEAVYVLPAGWPEPPQPNDPFRPQLKQLSDMQPPDIFGESLLDLSTNQVLLDQHSVNCLLILTEDKISQSVGNKEVQGTGGLMFTEIKLEHKFEILSK